MASLPPGLVPDNCYGVLFKLCDCHNNDKPANEACFPSQKWLMEHLCVSQSALNRRLTILEKAGILSRRRATVPRQTVQRTYFTLHLGRCAQIAVLA